MRIIDAFTRKLDLYQLGFLMWGIGALAVVVVIFLIGIAVGSWFGQSI